MKPFVYTHPGLGVVRVVAHPASKRISARWKGDNIKVVAPGWTTRHHIIEAVETMKERLLEHRPLLPAINDISFEDWEITVGHQNISPYKIQLCASLPKCRILIGNAMSLQETSTMRMFNNALLAIARKTAGSLLIPAARATAARLGCSPSEWKISHGHKVLGHCNTFKEISLSYINVLLPPRLRQYIICHELAHLTHMNHSVQFHTLCNRYLEGREKELAAELRRYRWPIER